MIKSSQARKWKRASASTGLIDYDACASLLRQCGSTNALAEGKLLHAHIAKAGYDEGTFLGNILVQMYGNCGSLEDAQRVFDNLRERNVFSWNIMMAAYAQNGHLQEARGLFDGMPQKNVVSWNAMLAAHAQNGHLEAARRLLEKMPLRNVVSWNALVAAYAQSGHTEDAKRMFETMPERNVVSFNAILAVCGQESESLQLLRVMEREGIQPNNITFSYAVDTSASLESGREIHAKIIECGMEDNIAVATALVRMYGKFGSLDDARNIFCRMPSPDVVLWTAMISACAQNGHRKESLQLFGRMDLEGVQPDGMILSTIIDACANLPALAEGKFIHRNIIVDAGFELDVALGTAIINLYGKCGAMQEARSVFEQLPQRNEVCWTAMIAAYSQNGHGKEALKLFKDMNLEGVFPDAVTFVSVLSACSHAGLTEDARSYFVSMHLEYGFVPTVTHYVCMLDLLSRAGQLEEAEVLIKHMPFEPDDLAWTTLMGACGVHGDAQRGARAGEHALAMNPENSAPYVLLSHLCVRCLAADS